MRTLYWASARWNKGWGSRTGCGGSKVGASCLAHPPSCEIVVCVHAQRLTARATRRTRPNAAVIVVLPLVLLCAATVHGVSVTTGFLWSMAALWYLTTVSADFYSIKASANKRK